MDDDRAKIRVGRRLCCCTCTRTCMQTETHRQAGNYKNDSKKKLITAIDK